MALSANITRPVRLPPGGLSSAKIKLAGYTNRGSSNTAFTVYKGAVVGIDLTDTAGYAGPMDFTAATGDAFMGIAAEKVSVTSSDTADGSQSVTVWTNGTWGFPVGNCTQADVGKVAYASDDNTVTSTSTNALKIGMFEAIDATYAWVNIQFEVLTA